MKHPFDVIVVGVGGMGAATCWQLARRGQRVLGLERFDIPHAFGSSHGLTRIIRLAYFESAELRARSSSAPSQLWREAGDAFGENLLVTTGGIDASAPGRAHLPGLARSPAANATCRTKSLPART